jgi:hypothetical protein
VVPGGSSAGRLSVRTTPVLRPPGVMQRTKIWEIGASLRCSIIGTCLPNAELRALDGEHLPSNPLCYWRSYLGDGSNVRAKLLDDGIA